MYSHTQGIKDAIYHYYGVTADPSSHSQLDGEDKLCMKGSYTSRVKTMQCIIILQM